MAIQDNERSMTRQQLKDKYGKPHAHSDNSITFLTINSEGNKVRTHFTFKVDAEGKEIVDEVQQITSTPAPISPNLDDLYVDSAPVFKQPKRNKVKSKNTLNKEIHKRDEHGNIVG